MKTDHQFFIGQKAFIEKNKKILVLIHPEKGLDFPGGKIQSKEEPELALKREVFEETGLQIEVKEPFIIWINHEKNIYLVGIVCRYITGEVTISKEHNDYRWVDEHSYQQINDASNYKNALKKYFTKYSLQKKTK